MQPNSPVSLKFGILNQLAFIMCGLSLYRPKAITLWFRMPRFQINHALILPKLLLSLPSHLSQMLFTISLFNPLNHPENDMKTKQLTVERANYIQAEWMKLDPSAPKEEKDRVFALMAEYPSTHVSGRGEFGVCMVQGQPCSIPIPFWDAMRACREYGGCTHLAWDGSKGEWYTPPCRELGKGVIE